MYLIPAIDIIAGKCVRLTKGDYNLKKEYADDPVVVAKQFEKAGLKKLHLVDLDGAKGQGIKNLDVLRKITSETKLEVDFGGGIKSATDLSSAFENGAVQVTGGSIAVRDPDLFSSWIKEFGARRIILGADVLHEKVMVSGWQKTSDQNLFEFLETYILKGIKQVICTDISKDGMIQGPSFKLYQKIMKQFPDLNLTASGGVSCMKDLEKLRDIGLYGAIIGKAYYEGHITLQNLANF